MPCRPSSAVHRCTQVPHAPSRPNRVAISWWYDGRLSSVSRLTISAVPATAAGVESSPRHGSPPRSPSNVRPSLHGTYSCGNHSLASDRWRSRLLATTGSSSMSRAVWSSGTRIPPLRWRNLRHRRKGYPHRPSSARRTDESFSGRTTAGPGSTSMSWAYSAGEMVSTAADLNRFYRALLGGRLLSRPLLAQMETTVPEDPSAPEAGGYGL